MQSVFIEFQVPALIVHNFRDNILNPFGPLVLSLTVDTDYRAKLLTELIGQLKIQQVEDECKKSI
jgi:hypothetical protein